jgi:hypothetical protein
LVATDFHPLYGAREVRRLGFERVARLVAHHSGARYEAKSSRHRSLRVGVSIHGL